MARVRNSDVFFAHMALHFAPDLSPSARRVGAGIIGHFNVKTGQCDPSVERLAAMLGLDRATVIRATGELCGPAGLFERVSHGGRSHRTAYLPRWEAFGEIVDDWNRRMKDGSAPAKVAKMRPSRSQNCDVNSRKNATQTIRRNYSNKLTVPVEGAEQSPPPGNGDASRKRSDGLRKNELRGSVSALPQVVRTSGASRADAAAAAEHRRLAAEIGRLPKHERAAAWLAAMGEKP